MDYQKHYNLLMARARQRILEGYVERHHILPRCMGGSDDPSNIVQLTPEEHFTAHVLLVKLYPDSPGLIFAVNMMCRGHNGKRSRKMYGWLKRRHAETLAEQSRGRGNSQYGTRWINDGVKSSKIKGDEPIPSGWYEGRVKTPKPAKVSKRELSKRHRERVALDALMHHDTISKAIRSLGLQTRGANYEYFKSIAKRHGLMDKFNSPNIKR